MIKEQLEMKDIQNRLRKLDNKPEIPYTEEETLFRRLNALKGGKRKSKAFGKTVSKRKRREKTRKGFKGRRTRIRVVK